MGFGAGAGSSYGTGGSFGATAVSFGGSGGFSTGGSSDAQQLVLEILHNHGADTTEGLSRDFIVSSLSGRVSQPEIRSPPAFRGYFFLNHILCFVKKKLLFPGVLWTISLRKETYMSQLMRIISRPRRNSVVTDIL